MCAHSDAYAYENPAYVLAGINSEASREAGCELPPSRG